MKPDLSKPITYWPQLGSLIGGVKEAVIVALLLTWQIQSDTGWVILTREQIEELGLSKDEFRTIRRNLSKLGILEEKRGKFNDNPRQVFYRIIPEAVSKLLMKKKYKAGSND
jgi:hypothetical protein